MLNQIRLPLAIAGVAASFAMLTGTAQAAGPYVRFTATPAKISPIANPTFKIARSGSFKSQTCRVDTRVYKTCGATWKPGTLQSGIHTAHVRAITTAGKTLAISYTWTIDTPPPAPVLHGGTPYNWVSLASRIVAFTSTATDIDHYTYQLDGGPTLSTTGSVVITKQGITQVSVVAVDQRGQASTATTGIVKLDNAGPTISIPSLPMSTPLISVVPAVTDAASGVASVSWAYSAGGSPGTWSAEQMAPTITVSEDGSYSFRVTAIDNAGNTSQTSFDLQQAMPVVPDITVGDVPTWTTQISIPVSATDAAGMASLVYRTRLIGQQWSVPQSACVIALACSDGTITVPSDGVYDIEVTATGTDTGASTQTFRAAQDSNLSVPNGGWLAEVAAIGGGLGAATVPPDPQQGLYVVFPPAWNAQMMMVSADSGATWQPVGGFTCVPSQPGVYIMRATFAYQNGMFAPWSAPTDSAILYVDVPNPNGTAMPWDFGAPC
ncbi:MAG: hypothetical protein QOF08_1905 [Gaiellales bacterium]|nr:hypothetical protein [Gaiellales bacterium]